ncbi:CheW domain protein [Thioalkalivibrio sp. K90mix]|uniref:chemotaxis protein CheW n=1 Tax=unclassified Thioalkalivibrio TaxID=2621013 RepID=UPI000195A578|nr:MULTISPECIES: chemotaxis protein CheW [unclassified Thioalkalivibrio]ADC71692.1 CheW domain protein [Thioalkalivibrio sp. K90mix]
MNHSRDHNLALKAEPEALHDYFGSLLDEPAPVAPAHLLRPDILEPRPAPAEPEPAAVPDVPVVAEAVAPPAPPRTIVESEEYPRPSERFSALVLEAGNLTLLAPLASLGGVAPLDDLEVRPTPNHSVWYLGLADTKQGRVQLIDLAAVVTPEDREYEPETARHVVFLAGSRFALACRSIQGTRVIEPQNLRWRSHRKRLPWLAGVEREQMATLLDLEALDRTLDQGSWEMGGAPDSSRDERGR